MPSIRSTKLRRPRNHPYHTPKETKLSSWVDTLKKKLVNPLFWHVFDKVTFTPSWTSRENPAAWAHTQKLGEGSYLITVDHGPLGRGLTASC